MKEIASLLEKCERQRVRDVLTQEQKKIEKELAQKRQMKEQQAKKDSGDKTVTVLKGYTVKINNYGVFISHDVHHKSSNPLCNNNTLFKCHCDPFLGWDQSDKFVKIYITLKGVHSIPSENVEATFTERYMNDLLILVGSKNLVYCCTSLLLLTDILLSPQRLDVIHSML